MQPHLTPYQSRLLAKTQSFFLILGALWGFYECKMSCFNLARATMTLQQCNMMYGSNAVMSHKEDSGAL